MIVLRSIPLSFAVFWRLLIVLPVALPLVVVFATLLTFFWALVSVLLAVPVVVTAQTFLTMIGIRAGLQALGAWNAPSFDRLLGASFKWALVQIAVALVLFGPSGIVLAVTGEYGPEIFGALLSGDGYSAWVSLLTSGTVFGTAMAVSLVLSFLAYAALMVPMAAAAFGAGADVQRLDLLWGLGSAFVSLLVVSVLAFAISILSGSAFASGEALGVAGIYTYAWAFDQKLPQLGSNEILRLAALTLLEVWTYAWIFAAAALAFTKRRGLPEKPEAPGFEMPRAESVDYRSLRKTRQ
jgi:hypothetical protein